MTDRRLTAADVVAYLVFLALLLAMAFLPGGLDR
jgi:hypothetical protein